MRSAASQCTVDLWLTHSSPGPCSQEVAEPGELHLGLHSDQMTSRRPEDVLSTWISAPEADETGALYHFCRRCWTLSAAVSEETQPHLHRCPRRSRSRVRGRAPASLPATAGAKRAFTLSTTHSAALSGLRPRLETRETGPQTPVGLCDAHRAAGDTERRRWDRAHA